jgi:hypothetical protein
MSRHTGWVMDDLCLLLDDGRFPPVAYLYNVFYDMTIRPSFTGIFSCTTVGIAFCYGDDTFCRKLLKLSLHKLPCTCIMHGIRQRQTDQNIDIIMLYHYYYLYYYYHATSKEL